MPKSLAYDPKFSLNAICPYFTMFPLEYPFKLLKKHKKDLPIVLDPFCGRGTTLYAARQFGLEAWGIDASPIAVAVAQAKLTNAHYEDVIDLAETFLEREVSDIPSSEFFHAAYHQSTLREICAIREGLLSLRVETAASILLRAAALGCLHGPLSKTFEGASYFSNQMPRTFATKPDYSLKYWREKNLLPPHVSVLSVLKKKLGRIPELKNSSAYKGEHVIRGDSTVSTSYKKVPQNFSVVITSPPYYGMKTYIQDQWLRLWFLGGSQRVDYNSSEAQINHNGQHRFISDLAAVWTNIYKSESDRLDLYIRFGSVPSAKSDAKLVLKNSLEESGGWRVISTKSASTAHAGKRQAEQMAALSTAATEFDFHVVRN